MAETIWSFAQKRGFTKRMHVGLSMIELSARLGPAPTGRILEALDEFSEGRDIPCLRNTRTKAHLGWCKVRKEGIRIELVDVLWDLDEEWEAAEQVFFHEVAHVLQWRIEKSLNHTALWAWVFNCFGFHPTRSANLSSDRSLVEAREKRGQKLLEDF